MKKAFALLIVAAVVGMASRVQASESTQAIVASYLEIHKALAADKLDGVKPAAEAIAKEAARMGAPGAEIQKTAAKIGSARNLKAARDAFGPLSDAVIAAATADDWKDVAGVKLGYCPMVNQSWIQKEGTVSNPYYGSSMLTCGDLKDATAAKKK